MRKQLGWWVLGGCLVLAVAGCGGDDGGDDGGAAASDASGGPDVAVTCRTCTMPADCGELTCVMTTATLGLCMRPCETGADCHGIAECSEVEHEGGVGFFCASGGCE